jgi:hypothetical protein
MPYGRSLSLPSRDSLRPARCTEPTVKFTRTEPSAEVLKNVLCGFPFSHSILPFGESSHHVSTSMCGLQLPTHAVKNNASGIDSSTGQLNNSLGNRLLHTYNGLL